MNRLIVQRIEYAARGGGTEEMTRIDRLDPRTQNLVQVDANAREKIVQ